MYICATGPALRPVKREPHLAFRHGFIFHFLKRQLIHTGPATSIPPLAFENHAGVGTLPPTIFGPRSKRKANRALRGQGLRPRLEHRAAPDVLQALDDAGVVLPDVYHGRVAGNGRSIVQYVEEKFVDVESLDEDPLSDVNEKRGKDGGDEPQGRKGENMVEPMAVV